MIRIKTIPHKQQRLKNGDVADYYEKDGGYVIAVSDLKNADYNFLIALHEFIELHLINKKGLPIDAVDKWDNENPDTMGDDPAAPYHNEHCFAEAIERLLASKLGVNWGRYNQKIEALAGAKRG